MSDQHSTSQSVVSSCITLTAVTAAVWLLLAWPAWAWAGPAALRGSALAAVLCLVPGWIVFAVSSMFRQTHAQVALVFIAGSTLRLMFVLLSTLFLQAVRPDLGFREFTVWLVAFYLITLLTETLIVLKQKPTGGSQPGQGR